MPFQDDLVMTPAVALAHLTGSAVEDCVHTVEHGRTSDGHPIYRVVAMDNVVDLQASARYLNAIIEEAVRLTGFRRHSLLRRRTRLRPNYM
jgi:hypothetical protein